MANWTETPHVSGRASYSFDRSRVLKPYVVIALCASAALTQAAPIHWDQQKAEILQVEMKA